ncbi:MAG: electron transport complex subunit RsxC [Buchnera aphidicola (Eriosoma harunire)]
MFNIFLIFNFLKKKISFYFSLWKSEYKFSGGLSIPANKNNQLHLLLKPFTLPNKIFISVNNCLIRQNKLCVTVGSRVYKGSPLTLGNYQYPPVHSSISGYISDIKIKYNELNFDSKSTVIVVTSDKKDSIHPSSLFIKSNYKLLSKEVLINKVYQYGIVGLGGSGFSCANKLRSFIRYKYSTLVVNAVECEPYVISDECLIHNHINEILYACEILVWILDIRTVLIAIEDDKLKTIQVLIQALKHFPKFELRIIPSKYPSGSSKQLIKILFNIEILQNTHATDIGILIHNVGTLFAVKKAIVDDIPLIERVVTITGDNVLHTTNYLIRIGTPIQHILDHVILKSISDSQVFLGGPISGYQVFDFNQTVSKTTNCILILRTKLKQQSLKYIRSKPCIRCSACLEVCPIRLLPQQLYWFIKKKDYKQVRRYDIKECIECGLCEQVCPSKIKLIGYFKSAKKMIAMMDREKNRIMESKLRFQDHQKRLNICNLELNLFTNHDFFNKNVKNPLMLKDIDVRNSHIKLQKSDIKNIIYNSIKKHKYKKNNL